VVKKYNIGLIIKNHEPKHIAEQIKLALKNNLKTEFESNIKKAAQELNWEHEEQTLIEVYKTIEK
jgi:hypothetical protein